MKTMKPSAMVLFILGILLTVGAFLGDKADNVPFVLSLVAPEYTEAQFGLVELEKKMALSPEDHGFQSLANIFLARLAKDNSPDRLAGVFITKIERHPPALVFRKLRVSEVVKVTFSLSVGQTIDWSIEKLSEAIIAIKTERIFRFSVFVLLGGILLQTVGFIMQVIEARRKGCNISSPDQPVTQTDDDAARDP